MKRLIFLFVNLFLFFHAQSSTYYWVNGSGSWSDYGHHWATSSGGSVFHVQPPTPADSVVFDTNSLNSGDMIFIDSTIINCRSLNMTGVNNPVIRGGGSMTIYGSIVIPDSVTWIATGNITLQSAFSANTLDLSGVLPNAPFYNMSIQLAGGGGWILLNGFTLPQASISTDINTTLNLNMHSVECYNFHSSGTLLLGTSTVNCENFHINGTPYVDADSSIIIAASDFYGGNNIHYKQVVTSELQMGDSLEFDNLTVQTISYVTNSLFHHVNFQGTNCRISNDQSQPGNNLFHYATVTSETFTTNTSNEFDSLIFLTTGIYIGISDTQQINNYIELNGSCSELAEMHANTAAVISMPAGTTTFNYALIENISFTGGATFTANNSVDAGGVSGITINASPSSNLYWVGGTGNWNDISHWSTSSGGTGGNCVPSPADRIFFDANSFAAGGDTVTINVPHAYCESLNMSGVNNPVITGGGSLTVFGPMIIPDPVTWIATSVITLQSAFSANALDLSGVLPNAPFYNMSIQLTGGGGWILLNGFTLPQASISTDINTTLNLNMHSVDCYNFHSSGTLFLGTSTVNCENFHINGTPYVDADSSIIIAASDFYGGNNIHYKQVVTSELQMGDSLEFDNLTVQTISYVTNSLFHHVNFQGTNCRISNDQSQPGNNLFHYATVTSETFTTNTSNEFDSLIFLTTGIYIGISDTQQINNYIELNGSCSELAEMHANTAAVISMPAGTTTFNYALIENISFTGGATFTANNSVDAGGVSGITINASPSSNLYWVGGTGNWNDISHWSTSSGGTGGNCVPSPADRIFFDANSFAAGGDTVTINVPHAYCESLNMSGVNNPVITGGGSLTVFGPMIIPDPVTWNATGNITLQSAFSANTLDLSGVLPNAPFYNMSIQLTGGGGWILLNDFTLPQASISTDINTTLNLNMHSVECYNFHSSGTLFLGTSTVNCENFHINGTPYVDADSSIIIAASDFYGGNNIHYKQVVTSELQMGDSLEFDNLTVQTISYVTNSLFHHVNFQGTNCRISNDQSQPGNNLFHYATVTSETFTTNTSNEFDSLILNNSGMVVHLSDTINILNYFQVNSDPGFPTSITGPALINYNDTLCADYIYLQNTTTTGGMFYAGDHSVDLGGNTGWSFTSCTPVISNVWPGDANYDLIVDNLDLLYIGVAYNDTGYVRLGATLNYTAQPCRDWYYQFINGSNVKHADSDGNGIIESTDTAAIGMNYGQTHPLRLAQNSSTNSFGAELYLEIPQTSLPAGSTVNIPIMLGTASYTADNIYGIAFTINYDPAIVVQGSININFSGSWIENSAAHLNLVKDFSNGKCDVAFTRVDRTDVSGYGQIGTLTFIISTSTTGSLPLSISKIVAISHNEIEVPLTTPNDSLPLSTEEIKLNKANVFPNPSAGVTKIQFENSSSQQFEIDVFDASGKKLMTTLTNNNSLYLDRKNFNAGIYYLTIRNDHSVFHGKIIFE